MPAAYCVLVHEMVIFRMDFTKTPSTNTSDGYSHDKWSLAMIVVCFCVYNVHEMHLEYTVRVFVSWCLHLCISTSYASIVNWPLECFSCKNEPVDDFFFRFFLLKNMTKRNSMNTFTKITRDNAERERESEKIETKASSTTTTSSNRNSNSSTKDLSIDIGSRSKYSTLFT